MDIQSEDTNQCEFYPFIREIGAYIRNPNQGEESWDNYKYPPPCKQDTKKLTLQVIPDIPYRSMAFAQTESRLIFAFSSQLQPEPSDPCLEAVQIKSFDKLDGRRQKKRICQIKSKISCMTIGLSTVQRQEILSLVAGVEEGFLYFFGFGTDFICRNIKLNCYPITNIRFCNTNEYFESRNIVAAAGEDQSIFLVNLQKLVIIAHLKQGNLPCRKPISLFFSESYQYIVMGLSDGCIRFWNISKTLRDKIQVSHQKPEKQYRGICPKYSISSAAVNGLVAVQKCNYNLMLLTSDNHLKLICVDIQDEEAFLVFFDYKIRNQTIATHLQVIPEKEIAFVSVGFNILQVSFDQNGVTAIRNYSLPAINNAKIDKFILNQTDQSYLGVLAERKFYIGKIQTNLPI